MVNFKHTLTTSGEKLYFFLRTWITHGYTLDDVFSWLEVIDNAEKWSEFIAQLVAVSLTGRVVTAGLSLAQIHTDESLYQRELRAYLNSCLSIDRDSLNRLIRFALPAVSACRRTIPHGVGCQLRRWARAEHPVCYLCGNNLNFDDENDDRAYTADHIWPSSFGGDSIIENLLPACHQCNGQHKRNFATWAMTNIQAIILSMNPSDNEFRRVQGMHRFALHHRRVQQLAIDDNLSLKEAYMRVGPSEELRSIDRNDVAHFFNLANHDATVDAW
jgi:hypothetical protein